MSDKDNWTISKAAQREVRLGTLVELMIPFDQMALSPDATPEDRAAWVKDNVELPDDMVVSATRAAPLSMGIKTLFITVELRDYQGDPSIARALGTSWATVKGPPCVS